MVPEKKEKCQDVRLFWSWDVLFEGFRRKA
jgi:hypothetical protein